MTALETAPLVITEPGLVRDLPDEAYHGDPVVGGSLSHSGAKTIVNKTPALFAWEREHGRPNKRAFDFGHAAHQMILGVGPEIAVVQKVAKDGTVSDADSYNTKSSQEHRDSIREAGGVPILRDEFDDVLAMAEAIKAHPVASKLLAPGSGEPEVSAFAPDPSTGVWLRCRYDWLRPVSASGRLILTDYKSAVDASDEAFAKAAINYGYVQQSPWYADLATLLGLAEDVAFVYIVQEKTPPYLVNVIQLDITFDRIGRAFNRRAITTYAECERTGNWPGYDLAISDVSAPPWFETKHSEEI